MTGQEFKASLKAAGYTQAAFAQVMGVHRETIGKQCAADRVEAHWCYALTGLIAMESASAVLTIAEKIDK